MKTQIVLKFLFFILVLLKTDISVSQTSTRTITRTFDFDNIGQFYSGYSGEDEVTMTFSQLPNTPGGFTPSLWTNGCRIDGNNTGLFNPCNNDNLVLINNPISFFNDRLGTNLFGSGLMEMESNETVNFMFDLSATGNGTFNGASVIYTGSINIVYEDADGNSIDEELEDFDFQLTSGSTSFNLPLSWTPPVGARIASISWFLAADFRSPGVIVAVQAMPFYVKGPNRAEVPIVETVRTPIIPQTIIYDPPGDGSSSTFNTSTEFCRDYSTSVETGMGFSNNTDVTLGVSGSVGFIATVDFEAGVTFSGGFGTTTNRTSESTFENCIQISQTFQTSTLDANIGADADLIIGISQLQNLAVGEVIEIDPVANLPIAKNQLFITTDESSATLAILTEELIQADIATLQNIINAGTATPVLLTQFQNQIDVWNQILAIKASNEANAAFETNFGHADYFVIFLKNQ